MFYDDDMAIFFADGSTAVLEDGTTFKCHVEYPEEFALQTGSIGGMVAAKPVMRYATASATLTKDTLVTIDGVKWRTHRPKREADGRTSVVELKQVTQ